MEQMTDEWVEMRRENILLRMLIMGPNGSGKTKGALEVGTKLAALLETRCLLLDTQHGQAKVYADQYAVGYQELVGDYSPEAYRAKITSAASAIPGGVLIIDGISQEWNGKGGVQAIVDRFSGWKEATPRHNDFVEEMLQAQLHIICTVRSKMKFDVSEVPRGDGNGTKQTIRKLGLGPEQRESMMYEFDVVASLDMDHVATFTNRCEPLTDTSRALIPGDDVAQILFGWLSEGDPPEAPKEATEEAVNELLALLREEGILQHVIDEKFAAARLLNRGKLHPDYVQENTEKSRQRLARKKPTKQPAEQTAEQETLVNA